MHDRLQMWFRLLKSAFRAARRHNVPRLSAALAFYALLSLAPVIVIMVSLAGLFLSSHEIEARIVEEARNIIGEPAANVTRNILASSRRPASNLIAFGASALFLIFGASRVFAQLNDAMQVIWETKRGGLKGTILNRLIGGAIVIAGALVFWLGAVAQTTLASVLSFVGGQWSGFEVLLVAADWIISLLLSVGIVAAIFYYLPRTHVPWRAALAGAVLTTLLFLLGRFAFGLYLRFGVITSIQGAAGSLVIVILWAYYVAQILFGGAEFTRAYTLAMGSATRRNERGSSSA